MADLKRSAKEMDVLAQLAAEHGKNPLGFFWVLGRDGGNPHLDFTKQSELWRSTLAKEEWFEPFATRATPSLISDNGDLVYDLAGETLLCETPPNSSLLVRLESKDRIGEVCAWESGDCEVQLAEFEKDDAPKSVHHQLKSGDDFHAHVAEVFLFVAKRQFPHEL